MRHWQGWWIHDKGDECLLMYDSRVVAKFIGRFEAKMFHKDLNIVAFHYGKIGEEGEERVSR